MSALINLLLTSGQLLGRAALRTLQEAASASARARDHIAQEADRLGCVIEEHDSMLGLIQARAPELSQLLGADADIRVAVVDGAVRDTLESYLRSLRVPYVRLNDGGAAAATATATAAASMRKNDQVFLTVSPRGGPGEKPTGAHVSAKRYSTTRPYDKDLEFLKQQIREKFKKLLQNNVGKGDDAIDSRVRDIDISKTLRQMTDTQKFILQDLDNLMRCLREIDELRSHLKFAGIKNNTIRVMVKGDGDPDGREVSDDMSLARLQAFETTDGRAEEKDEETLLEEESKDKTLPHLADSYARYLSKVAVARSNLLNDNKDSLEPVYVHAKRKREEDSVEDAAEGKGRILNVIAQKYLTKRRKRFCETMLNVGFGRSDQQYMVNCERLNETTSKRFKLTGTSDNICAEKMFSTTQDPGGTPKNTDESFDKFDENIRIEEEEDSTPVTQKNNEDGIINEPDIETSRSGLSLQSTPPLTSKSNFTKEKAQRRWERRIKKFMKSKELDKAQKNCSPSQERLNKAEKNLQKMKRLEEQVRHDCKLMFSNKRQFTRFEKQLEQQLWNEKENEHEKKRLLLNQTIFNDVESQIARDVAIGQLEKEVEFASRLISENQNAFNMFQRRMLHKLVNDIEPGQTEVPNMSLLCGTDITVNDKSSFDMLVEKLQNYDLINVEESPDDVVENIERAVAHLTLQPEDASVLEPTPNGPSQDVEFLAEFDGVRISIVRMPGDEVVIEGDIEEALEAIEQGDSKDVYGSKECQPSLLIESAPKKVNTYNFTEVRDEKKMTEDLLQINEKVFNDCEKMMKTVQIIEPKTKFSTNKKEEDPGKLLNHNKNKIGDDKRKISTGKPLYKNSNGNIFKKSKSETSLLADIKKQNLSLYEQIFEFNDQKASNLNLDDLFGGQMLPPTENIQQDLIENGKMQNDVDIEKAIEDINQMLTQKPASKSTKATKTAAKEREKKAPYKKTKTKQSRQSMEKKYEPRSSTKVPKIFCRNGDKHLILDTEKVQEEIVLKQKMRTVLSKHKTPQSSVRKQNLRKATTKEDDKDQQKSATSSKKPGTPERARQNAHMKSEALKRNKFINQNAIPVAIDKNLEKKMIKKDIATKKETRVDNCNNNSTQKQIKYKSPEKSKYTKIYEQIKARQVERMQQLKAKKKAGHDGSDSKSKTTDGSKIDCSQNRETKEKVPSQTKKSTGVKPVIIACKKATSGLTSTAEETDTPTNKRLHVSMTETEVPVAQPTAKPEDVRPSTKDTEVSELSVETLFTSKGMETMNFVKDASSSDLEDAEEPHSPTLITSRNCALRQASPEGDSRPPGSRGSRLSGVVSLGDLAVSAASPDDYDGGHELQRKQTRVLATPTICNGVVSTASGVSVGLGSEASDGGPRTAANGETETGSEVSGTSTVWKDSFQSVTELMEEMRRNRQPSPEDGGSLSDLSDLADLADYRVDVVADADAGDAPPSLCLELMDEQDIMSLLSTVSSMCSLDSETKQKVVEIEQVRESKSEIVGDRFSRRPWGTNVVNEVPSHVKKAPGPATLPQTSIWSHGPRARPPPPPKPRPDPRDKKYRYESKEVVMGNKVTRVTYLVEE